MTVQERIEAAKSHLIFHYPFIAAPMCRLALREDEGIGTAATDGRRIVYNPEYLSCKSQSQLLTVLAHEVLHVTHLHHLRRGARNPKAWNAAADYVVNLVLEEAGFEIWPGLLLERRFSELSTEQVYTLLVTEAEQELARALGASEDSEETEEKKDSDDPGEEGDREAETGREGEVNDIGEDGSVDAGDGEEGQEEGDAPVPSMEDFIPQGDGGQVMDLRNEDGSTLSPADRNEEEQDLAEVAYQAAVTQALRDGAGSDQAGAARRVTRAHSPAFDARSALLEFAQEALGLPDYRWNRPNHRYSPLGLYLPGLVAAEGLRELVVVIDTSGSILPLHLAWIAGVLEDILSAFPETLLVVVYCDSRFRDFEELTAQDLPLTLERASGGGGTLFKPAFEWVRARTEPPAALVYLTDLWNRDGQIPDPGYPVVWVSIDRFAPSQTCGRRINLDLPLYT